MRYGVKPKTASQRPENTLRTAAAEKPNLSRWIEVAYPIFLLELDCTEEVSTSLSRLEHFILRSIHEANARSLSSISRLLGIEESYIHKTVSLLLTSDHLIEQTVSGFRLTEAGVLCLEEKQKQTTRIVPKSIMLDGVTGKPLPLDFYKPTAHTLLKGKQLPHSVRRIVPGGLESRDIEFIANLSREEKERLGISPDLIRIETSGFGYEILYHIFHIGVMENRQIAVFDSCSCSERSEFRHITHELIGEAVPEIESPFDKKSLAEQLAEEYSVMVPVSDIEFPAGERLHVYVKKEQFHGKKRWEYTILTKPNLLPRQGFILNFYPKDEETLKSALLQYSLRDLKRSIGAGKEGSFSFEASLAKGFADVTKDCLIEFPLPDLTEKDLRRYALEQKEHLAHEVLQDRKEQDEEEDYAELF
ncbi:hypothetical protein [Mesobacillus jeotgali]|uniref:hypothetical protein n=1 Tax=Mesobacillus jeotgali TaxID=129985 RepID=UPI001CFE7EB4|nr:hypothetical protein [Mesobacillus jeotgali]